MRRRLSSVLACAVLLAGIATDGQAVAYRCEIDGRVVYSDLPCAAGRQTEIATDARGPMAADRAAAAARLLSDKATADAMQRARLEREKVEPIGRRAGSDRTRQVQACSKLGLRAKRAREDYDRAMPKDRSRLVVRMRRADEDFAALCKQR